MEKFKGNLKKKLAFMMTFNGLVVIFVVLTAIYGNITTGRSQDIADMIHGFQVGIFIGIQIAMLTYITKYKKALKIENELKKLYIEENDERKKFIQDKIGVIGFTFTLGVIATATVISGFFNQIVFATLFGVLIFIIIVIAFLKFYYDNKF